MQKKQPLWWSESDVPCGCMQVAANRVYEAFLLGWHVYAGKLAPTLHPQSVL